MFHTTVGKVKKQKTGEKARKKRKSEAKVKNIFNTILQVNKLTIQPIYHNIIIQQASAPTAND